MTQHNTFHQRIFILLLLTVGLSSCAIHRNNTINTTGFNLDFSKEHKQVFYGQENDLATAGLGLSGLRGQPPRIKNINSPTVEELRRSAIYANYRSLLAISDRAGFARMHHENFTERDGKVSGTEFLIPLNRQNGEIAATLMLQIPSDFEANSPCLVATASSGSRGIYGAIGVVGGWALHKKCAVVYTDKGTGTGFHWLDSDEVVSYQGELSQNSTSTALFRSRENDAASAFKQKFPHRLATKHAHSQTNPDQYWGQFVISSIDYALEKLSEQYQRKFTSDNTLILGAGISNGAASVIAAAEQTKGNLFDGIVVSEPAINIKGEVSYTYVEDKHEHTHDVRNLPDIAILHALYLPCAARTIDKSFFAQFVLPKWKSTLDNRCQRLAASGLLKGETLDDQSQESLEYLKQSGLDESSYGLSLMYTAGHIWEAYLVNYVNNYGRYSVYDHLCNYSYAFTDQKGHVIATPKSVKTTIFSTSGGIIPVAGLAIVNDNAWPKSTALAYSQDYEKQNDLAFNNLLCLKNHIESFRVQKGIREASVEGHLHKVPTIIVHGLSDNLIQVKNSARAYLALNNREEDNPSIRYYEIDNAQHFDAIVDMPAFSGAFVPLHHYFDRSLDMMLSHLRLGTKLAPSQRVLTKPIATTLEKENLPDIQMEPGPLAISVEGGVIRLP